MRMVVALVISALCGFIALSYEIVWVRVYTFVTRGAAESFGELLGAYLLGLAIGSLISLLFQEESEQQPGQLAALSRFVLLANVVGFLLIPIVARLTTVAAHEWALVGFGVGSLLLGATFPLICHFAIAADDKAGAGLSYLYLANILGSGAGSLLTGFVLMDYLPIMWLSVVLALLGLALTAALDRAAGLSGGKLARRLAVVALLAAAVPASAPYAFDQVWERLQFKREFHDPKVQAALPFRTIIESKSGVVTIDQGSSIYGGGAYDGVMYCNPVDASWMIRPYAVSALHGAPKRVLMIGLSGGAWANVVAHNPHVEQLTVVEINRGYIKVVEQYPQVNSLLTNPKVKIVIDDGRRWLRRNPDQKFDMIVCNTTHHWRAFASNLLSAEYLRMVRSHLAPGGVTLFNATSSLDAEKTALSVFRHAMMVVNCIAASDSPISFDKQRWISVMRDYTIDGKRLFDLTTEKGRAEFRRTVQLADTLTEPPVIDRIQLTSEAEMRRRSKDARVITDDNMASEW